MENVILLFFDLGLLTFYALAGLGIFLTIQSISYRIFHFNLYKWLNKKLFALS